MGTIRQGALFLPGIHTCWQGRASGRSGDLSGRSQCELVIFLCRDQMLSEFEKPRGSPHANMQMTRTCLPLPTRDIPSLRSSEVGVKRPGCPQPRVGLSHPSCLTEQAALAPRPTKERGLRHTGNVDRLTFQPFGSSCRGRQRCKNDTSSSRRFPTLPDSTPFFG